MAGLEEDIGVAKGGQAIPFVVEDSEEGLCITEEARKALESMEGPLCVLCVVGGQGNGKSELMNRALFAHAENGFPVGGTQGIWMWSKPIPGTTSDGLDINILVMDAEGVPTEGCLSGSFEGGGAGVGKENPLHSISLLLSSFWVYMSLGGLSDAAVGDLASLAQGIARNVRMGPVGQEEVDVESMASCFPKLWWVLRDATPAQLVDDVGRNLTSRQYLERAVSGDVNSSFSQSKSRSRAIVRMCFEDRDCFPLAPAYEQSSPSASLGSPRTPSAGYLRQAQVLGGRVVQNADSKTINGVQVTGPMLALLADSYVTSANSGSHLSVKDAWDSVCDAECERSMAACAGVYERMAGSIRVESLPMPLYELTQWHTEAAGEALRMFEDQTKGREGAAKYRSLLEERLRGLFRGIDADNHHIGCLKAKEALEGLYSEVDARLHEGGYGEFGAYERDRARVRARFLEEVPRNMHSMLVLHEFMEEKLSGAATRFLTKTSEEADDSRQRLETEVEKMRFGVMQQQRGLERELEELKERLTLQEDYLAAGKARERELRESLTSEREKHSVEVAELGQAHSRALQDALRESDESERRRIDSEFRMREAESRLASLSERRAPVPKKRSSPATPDARKVEDAHVRDVLRQVCTSVRAAALNSRQTAERSRASASAFAPPQDAPPAAPEWREVEDEAGVLAWCEAALEAVASACEGVDRDAKATAKLVQDLSQACKTAREAAAAAIRSPPPGTMRHPAATPGVVPGRSIAEEEIEWFSPLPVGQTPAPHGRTPGGGLLRRALGTPGRDALRVTPFSQPAHPEAHVGGSARVGKVALFSPGLEGGGAFGPGGGLSSASKAPLPTMQEGGNEGGPHDGVHRPGAASRPLLGGQAPVPRCPGSASSLPDPSAKQFPGLGGRLSPDESSPPPEGAGAHNASHSSGDSSREGPRVSPAGDGASPALGATPPPHWSASTVASDGAGSAGLPLGAGSALPGSAVAGAGADQRDGQQHSREALFGLQQNPISDRIDKLERTMEEMRKHEAALQQQQQPAVGAGGMMDGPPMGWCCVIESTRTQGSERNGRLYTEYRVCVSTPGQRPVRLGKRYSQFLAMHRKLCKTFPHVAMPPNSSQLFGGWASSVWFGRFDADFIECRRVWLEAYATDILNTPSLAHSSIVTGFIESDLLLDQFVNEPPVHLAPLTPTSAAGLRGGYTAPPPTTAKPERPLGEFGAAFSPASKPSFSSQTPGAADDGSAWAARMNQTLPAPHSSPAALRGEVAGAFTPQPHRPAVMSLRQARQASLTFSPLQVVAPTEG